MAKVRKNYWLDADLLSQAQSVLGTTTETETVVEALRRVTEGEELARLLAEGRAKFPSWGDPYHEAESSPGEGHDA